MLRVLHVINGLGVGGAENLVKSMVPLFPDFSVQADVFALRRTGSFLEEEIVETGTHLYYGRQRGLYSPLHAIDIAQVASQGYHLIHSHLFPAQYWVVVSKLRRNNLRKVRLVTTEHSTHNRRRNLPILRAAEFQIYRRYDAIICISESVQRSLLQWIPAVADMTMTIQNGVEFSRFFEARPYLPSEIIPVVDNKVRLLLMVARMTKQKDHQTVIRATKNLKENYHLILVGDGPLRQSLQKLTNNLNLSDRVHFLGNRRDVDRLMKTADVLILSSHWEGFGLVVVEAMASGKPIIASRVPGLAEIVQGAGVLFPPGDDTALSDSIAKVIEDPSLYDSVSSACLRRAQSFAISSTVEKYSSLYHDLC